MKAHVSNFNDADRVMFQRLIDDTIWLNCELRRIRNNRFTLNSMRFTAAHWLNA